MSEPMIRRFWTALVDAVVLPGDVSAQPISEPPDNYKTAGAPMDAPYAWANVFFVVGLVMIIAGVLLTLGGLIMDVSVDSEAIDAAGDPGRIFNIGLISMRQTITTIGGTLFLSGWVAAGAGLIRRALPPLS